MWPRGITNDMQSKPRKEGSEPIMKVTRSAATTTTIRVLVLAFAALTVLGTVSPSVAQPAYGRMPYVWGDNAYRQLGTGDTADRLTPAQTYRLPKLASVAAGWAHSLAITRDGRMLAWGDNDYGQLGDGSTASRYLPADGPSLPGLVSVVAGREHSLALLADGTVWAWGRNNYGQLGDGTTSNRYAPVQVQNLTNIVQIATNQYSNVALRADGTVWAWGYNYYGQLGDGTFTNRSTPVQVVGITTAVAVDAGFRHSGAVLADGTVRLWGENTYGQLGDGTTTDRSTPVQPLGLPSIISIAAGGGYTLFLATDGRVFAAGYNGNGALGDGTTTNRSTPVQVPGLSGVTAVEAGTASYARVADGTWRSWGYNYYGAVGDWTFTNRLSPVTPGPAPAFASLGTQYNHVLALTEDGELWVWGRNNSSQLGLTDGTTGDVPVPSPASGLRGVVQIAGGYRHCVALCGDGTVWTWGEGADGRLGLGPGFDADRSVPTMVTALMGRRAVAVAAGLFHSLALLEDGTVWAWGYNVYGQLGDASVDTRTVPVRVYNLTNVVAIAAGSYHSLALLEDGTVWAWGYNYYGQLGDGTTTNRAVPVKTIGISNAVAVAAGYHHSLALLADGTIKAWGYNYNGELGDGTTTNRTTPVTVSGLSGVSQIAAGGDHSLALRGMQAYAWGYNGYGQLGDGTTTNRTTPVAVSGMTSTVAIAAGYNHSYGLLSNGQVRSWGRNADGQLGNGTRTDSSVKVAVSGLTDIENVFAGWYSGYALPRRASSSLVVSNASGRAGQTVQLAALLTDGTNPLSGRSIAFSVAGTHAGSSQTDASGVATLAYQIPGALDPGDHVIRAAFAGDGNYTGSTGEGTLTVLKGDTSCYTIDRSGTISDSVVLRGYLKRISDNAWLDGKTVAFSIDGTLVGSATTGATGTSGRADLTWTITDGPATRTILAEFAGDASYNGSSGTATLTANTVATKMSGLNRDGKITSYRIFKAWLWRMDNSPVRNKTIAFKLDGTQIGTDVTRTTGLAQIGYTIADGAGAGTRTILAEWAGDGGYLASSCANTLTVYKATPYIWVMPRSVPQGGVVRLYAYFRRLADYQKQEGKTVTWRVDGTWIADVVTGTGADAGIARYQYNSVEAPGAHTMRCEFAGDAWLDAGYGEGTLTIY